MSCSICGWTLPSDYNSNSCYSCKAIARSEAYMQEIEAETNSGIALAIFIGIALIALTIIIYGSYKGVKNANITEALELLISRESIGNLQVNVEWIKEDLRVQIIEKVNYTVVYRHSYAMINGIRKDDIVQDVRNWIYHSGWSKKADITVHSHERKIL